MPWLLVVGGQEQGSRLCVRDEGSTGSRNKDIKSLLLADDHVVVADSEDALQISIQKEKTVTSKYGLKILTIKTKQWLLKEEIL